MKEIAPFCKGAGFALGLSGSADGTAVENDAVAEVGTFFRGQNGSELVLDLFRLLAFGKAQFVGDSDAMGVTDHAAGGFVQVSQKQIGSLSSHTG